MSEELLEAAPTMLDAVRQFYRGCPDWFAALNYCRLFSRFSLPFFGPILFPMGVRLVARRLDDIPEWDRDYDTHKNQRHSFFANREPATARDERFLRICGERLGDTYSQHFWTRVAQAASVACLNHCSLVFFILVNRCASYTGSYCFVQNGKTMYTFEFDFDLDRTHTLLLGALNSITTNATSPNTEPPDISVPNTFSVPAGPLDAMLTEAQERNLVMDRVEFLGNDRDISAHACSYGLPVPKHLRGCLEDADSLDEASERVFTQTNPITLGEAVRAVFGAIHLECNDIDTKAAAIIGLHGESPWPKSQAQYVGGGLDNERLPQKHDGHDDRRRMEYLTALSPECEAARREIEAGIIEGYFDDKTKTYCVQPLSFLKWAYEFGVPLSAKLTDLAEEKIDASRSRVSKRQDHVAPEPITSQRQSSDEKERPNPEEHTRVSIKLDGDALLIQTMTDGKIDCKETDERDAKTRGQVRFAGKQSKLMQALANARKPSHVGVQDLIKFIYDETPDSPENYAAARKKLQTLVKDVRKKLETQRINPDILPAMTIGRVRSDETQELRLSVNFLEDKDSQALEY